MPRPGSLLARYNRVSQPKVKRSYITQSGGQWHPGDIALAFALVIREHDSADALRQLARRLVDKVCLEHQPNMKLLSRTQDDQAVWAKALRIVNRVCEMWKILPTVPFPRNLVAPKCHMKSMWYVRDGHFWKCQHCSHTKLLE